MRTLTWQFFRKNHSLLSLFAIIGTGGVASALYLARLATKSPDVAWTRKNPEPWNDYENKQYKFYSSGIKQYNPPEPRPKF